MHRSSQTSAVPEAWICEMLSVDAHELLCPGNIVGEWILDVFKVSHVDWIGMLDVESYELASDGGQVTLLQREKLGEGRLRTHEGANSITLSTSTLERRAGFDKLGGESFAYPPEVRLYSRDDRVPRNITCKLCLCHIHDELGPFLEAEDMLPMSR